MYGTVEDIFTNQRNGFSEIAFGCSGGHLISENGLVILT